MNILWKLKSNGRSEYTIKNIGKCLRVLAKNTDLDNPDSIKSFIASVNGSEGYKRNLTNAYVHYLKYKGLAWTKPLYRESAKFPKIPTDEKLNMIISAAPKNLALRLLISKETGMRPIELMRLRVRDIDLNNGNVYPATAKGGSPRAQKLSTRTISLLRGYVAKYDLALDDSLTEGI